MSDTPPPFAQLGLSAPILQALNDAGYEAPSPIQAAAIPPLLAGRDIIGQAQTGTGKTAAFALPLLTRIDLERREPQVLVLAPTRELAIQVAEAFQTYAHHLPGFHVLPIYGGQDMSHQLRLLRRGVHVLVGTPGRVADHLRRGTISLKGLSALVLDEADEMLRMGFIDEVENIIAQSPESRQVALFSATMPKPIRKVADSYLKDPAEISIKNATTTVSAVRQRYWPVAGLHKLDALTRILEVEPFDGVIVFVRTKSATEELAEKLEARGHAAAAINGDMNQPQRERTVERLKKADLDILVATDVAARGLDVPRISHVINYDIPHDTEAYVHRIGRTGRAGRAGEAILFVTSRERRMLRAIEKATQQPIEAMDLPSHEEVTDHRVSRFQGEIDKVLDEVDLAFFEDLLYRYSKERETDPLRVAAAMAFLAQKAQPLRPSENKTRERPHKAERSGGPDQQRPRRERKRDDDAAPLVVYRFAVGRSQGVEVKNVVGAIANEAGLEHRYIGRVELGDDGGTVELPDGMPKEIFQHLQRVRVCGHPLGLSFAGGEAAPERPRKPRGKPAPKGNPGKPRGKPPLR